ncbi:hypothetical protein [Flavobacterium tibetense]|jgi:hypothetical protein|uniref:DUF4293 domain-containing protein n=1 Tax=Flavobacterium tibetense TaxID=2233533 RepID=A0A365P1A9_9FLAO|nr:hypothetical protein [Flavobacterium tibetense]RBA28258.1 hypothetical protein DPN68_07440 [Flavobacterium tibetense]
MIKEIWNYIRVHKTINLLNLLIVIILFVPFTYSLNNTSETEKLFWVPNFIFKELELVIFYISLVIFTVGFQVSKRTINKKIFILFNLVICFFFFLHGIILLIFPILDFAVGLGSALSIIIFPLSLIIFKSKNYMQIDITNKYIN